MLLILDHMLLALLAPAVEWKHSSEHLEHDNAYCPPVGWEGVTIAFQQFRGEVGRRSRPFEGGLVVEKNSGHAEVNDLEIALLIDK